jgi:iron(III) transport system substrate-binding protein
MNPIITRRKALAGLAAVSALPHLAPPARAQAGGVVVYTSNNQQAVQAITDTAQQRVRDLRFSFVTGGSGVLLRRIETEAAATTQADIFWSSSANTLGAFRPLFQSYRSPEAAAIPAALAEPENLWTASNIHVVTLMLNNNQLGGAPKPTSWAALLDPRWKGKAIIADPANSSTAFTILWGVKASFGADALKKLAANVIVTAQAPTVLRAVAQGEYAVGLTFESNAYAYVAGGQREIELIYPSDGTFTSPEFLSLVKNAPNGANARRAFDLIISKEVQTALLEAAFRRPSRSDIDVAKIVKLPNISDIRTLPIDENEAARQRAAFLAEWQGYVAAAR